MRLARGVVALLGLAAMVVGSTSGASAEEGSARLTRAVPGVVLRTCADARPESPIPLVCPPLVPQSRYRPFPGLRGAQLGNVGDVRGARSRLYLVGFNAGDTGPRYWHWIAGMGTPEAIRYWVLSDARNVVRGKPARMPDITVDGARVQVWRFPEHPAGGPFGGHLAAITATGKLRAVASVHGDNARASAHMAVALARQAARSNPPAVRRFDRDGIAFEYPRGWFVTTRPLSNGVDPAYRFAVSSDPVRRTPRDDGPCLPGVAQQLPDDAVLAYLREAVTGRGTSLARMQPRPRSFRLPTRSDNALCGFPSGRWVPFRSGGRAFYLGIYVGQRAPAAHVQALQRLLDQMRIAPRETRR